MTRETWAAVAALAGIAILEHTPCTFGLWFAPGWANGWPFGIPMTLVWPAGMALVCFTFLMSLAVLWGAIYRGTADRNEAELRKGGRAFRLWIAIAAGLALMPSLGTFGCCRSAALEAFPNGYPNRTVK